MGGTWQDAESRWPGKDRVTLIGETQASDQRTMAVDLLSRTVLFDAVE